MSMHVVCSVVDEGIMENLQPLEIHLYYHIILNATKAICGCAKKVGKFTKDSRFDVSLDYAYIYTYIPTLRCCISLAPFYLHVQ